MPENKNQTPEVDIKRIIKAAAQYYKTIAPYITLKKVRIEEVIKSPTEWRVTLSHPVQEEDSIFGHSSKREYKEFIIEPTKYEVLAMKIRQL